MSERRLEVDIRHRQGSFALHANFSAPPGLTCLFGRSGSGKTTLVDAIAGLNRPDQGRILLDGVPLLDTDRRIFTPAHRRRVGYVFQDARLFPHLSVRQNLRYGSWFARKARAYAHMDAIVDMLGIAHLLDRRPSALSGGEKQRVAIGRALLTSPRLLLMDEPLASLDDARKAEILPYVERLRDQANIPIVYVSHSVAEVGRLATTIVVLAEGAVVASGPARTILAQSGFFQGTDRGETGALLETRIEAQDEAFALTVLACGAGHLYVPRIDRPVGTQVRLRIRARDVTIATRRPDHLSAQNILEGVVAAISGTDDPVVEVRIDCRGDFLTARVTRRAVAMLALDVGQPVFAIVKSITFDTDTLG